MMFSGKVSHWGFGAKSGREFILFQFFCFCFFRGAQAMSRNHVFSCFKFLELFIRVHNHFFDWRDSIKKWLCKKVLERLVVQSISCFKVMKIFSCWVNEKRVSTVTINSLLVTFLEVMTYSVLINKNSHGVDGVHLSYTCLWSTLQRVVQVLTFLLSISFVKRWKIGDHRAHFQFTWVFILNPLVPGVH